MVDWSDSRMITLADLKATTAHIIAQIQEAKMAVQADVATLTEAVATLTTNVQTATNDIAKLLSTQQQAIDSEDLAAIQQANTNIAAINEKLTAAIATVPTSSTT